MTDAVLDPPAKAEAAPRKKKATRPAGWKGMVDRMKEYGTAPHDADLFMSFLPTDKKTGRVIDRPAEEFIDKLESLVAEDDADPFLTVRRVYPLTVEKAKQIRRTGKYEPPVAQAVEFQGEIPDEEFDEGDDDGPPKAAKKPKPSANK